jgi:hypothetical protein
MAAPLAKLMQDTWSPRGFEAVDRHGERGAGR